MALYDSLFGMMDLQAAQLLVTSNDFADASFRQNLKATAEDLLKANVVPIFNENDAISSRHQTNQVFPGCCYCMLVLAHALHRVCSAKLNGHEQCSWSLCCCNMLCCVHVSHAAMDSLLCSHRQSLIPICMLQLC